MIYFQFIELLLIQKNVTPMKQKKLMRPKLEESKKESTRQTKRASRNGKLDSGSVSIGSSHTLENSNKGRNSTKRSKRMVQGKFNHHI